MMTPTIHQPCSLPLPPPSGARQHLQIAQLASLGQECFVRGLELHHFICQLVRNLANLEVLALVNHEPGRALFRQSQERPSA